MKARQVTLIILLIIIADQALKIWVKTHMPLSSNIRPFGQKADWFQIYFIENEGMAWGWKFGGEIGKISLTLFRLMAVIFGVYYIRTIIRKQYSRGFIACVGLIFAGALGNLIDSLFYGLIFEESSFTYVAKMFPAKGYAGFLHGRVVDMLYFPIIHTQYPNWVPMLGGRDFEFFSPVFNLADASISVGVIFILLFQKRFFHRIHAQPNSPVVETGSNVNDDVQVS